MIIGVDAGALSITDERLKVGVYRVTYNLLKVLGKIDTKNEYRLYTFIPIPKKSMDEFGPSMKNVVLRPSVGWFTIRLPLELHLHAVDCFLGLSQALPPVGCRTIGFVYDLAFLRYPQAYPNSYKRLKEQTHTLVSHADYIVSISHATASDIGKNFGVPKNRIVVSYPGVDARFTYTGYKHKEDSPYFLFVGALNRNKNIPTLLRAFETFLKSSKKEYRLICIGGDYWVDPEIAIFMKKLNLQNSVVFTGFVSDEMLPSYYRGALSLVSASLWEGFCLPAAEAMACGSPVIASNAGSLPEIVGDAGFCFNPLEERSLVEAMTIMAEDKNKRSAFSRAALRQAQHFSWKRMANDVLSLLIENV